MTEDSKWIEIPVMLNEKDSSVVEQYFRRFDIKFTIRAMESRRGYISADLYHSFRVLEIQATAAAIVIRNVLEIDDPATAKPFHGACPACGETVNGSWNCPSCEISFSEGYEENDPLVEFIRQHDGFKDT